MTSTISASTANSADAVPSIEQVSPDTAREWLGRNTKNRNLRKNVVATYARDMRNGRWRFTGESIKFDINEDLVDGQHRLHAIINADVTIPMLVVRNVAPEAQDVMDTGTKRTAGDALSLHGEKNTALTASIAAMIINNGVAWHRRVTTAEILEAVAGDDSIRMVVSDILPQLKLGDVLTPSVAGYAYWKLNSIDHDAAWKFFHSLSSMVGFEEGSPVLALHRRLRNIDSRAKGSRVYRGVVLACVFTAWNAWRKDKQISKIQLTYNKQGQLFVPDPH